MSRSDYYWRVAPDQYSCVPPPGFEADPAVTAAIREFDAGAVPMWRIQLWTFPGSSKEVRVVHHVIGRYIPVPRGRRAPFRVEMPAHDHSPAPTLLDHVLEDDSTLQYQRGGPGGFVPWDWAFYRWCRWQYDACVLDRWIARAEAKQRRLRREWEAYVQEEEYRKKQIEPWILKKLEQSVTQEDWNQYLAAMWGRNRGAHRRAPKQYAFLGRSPRPGQNYGRVAPAQALGES